jgi:hypothetical protein
MIGAIRTEFIWLFCTVSIYLGAAAAPVKNQVLNVGFLGTLDPRASVARSSGQPAGLAFLVAIDYINNRSDLLPNTRLVGIVSDTRMEPQVAVPAALDQVSQRSAIQLNLIMRPEISANIDTIHSNISQAVSMNVVGFIGEGDSGKFSSRIFSIIMITDQPIMIHDTSVLIRLSDHCYDQTLRKPFPTYPPHTPCHKFLTHLSACSSKTESSFLISIGTLLLSPHSFPMFLRFSPSLTQFSILMI